MRIEFHPEILDLQQYSCNCCGRGCRSFLVPVYPEERKKIEARADWRKEFEVAELFVKHRAAGEAGYGLAKRSDGSCVFLDGDNLCVIHKRHGLSAKPLACQLYPFVLTPVGGTLRIGLRFDCPAVCESAGKKLSGYRAEISRLARQLIKQDIDSARLPCVCPGRRVSPEYFEAINETFIKIVCSDAQDLITRLHWLRGVTEHINMVKWENVEKGDFKDLLAMLQGGVLAELQREPAQRCEPVGKPRKLLGQIFFLMCQPTSIVTGPEEGWLTRVRHRLNLNRDAKYMRRTEGKLPRIQPDWPDCDLSELEESFGAWGDDVQGMLSRYLICRIGSLGYCGPNFYGYSMTEGIQTLLMAMVTVGWVMRICAVKAGRKHIELSDAQTAVMTIDGNLGYSSALGFGPSKLRLKYLSDHLRDFINWYCV
jgi:lysine-N-methylase